MVASLSDLAETVLSIVADIEMNSLVRKLGTPILSTGPRVGKPCRYAIVGLGKLGGREINYHSDLDLIILYEGEGKPYLPNNQTHDEQQPDNNSFFVDLTQRIIKTLSNHGPLGRLYELDLRLRPTGRSGSLVIPIGEFHKRGVEDVMAEAREIVGTGPTYVTYDIDFVDPTFAPGTGTPSHGGFLYYEVLEMLQEVAKRHEVVGMDLVEVAPDYDHSQSTSILAAQILLNFLGFIFHARGQRG